MSSLQAIFGQSGPLAEVLPGFRPRRDQLAMAEAVAEAIDSRGELIVEAGTGIGKTYAYLVPALLSGRRIIVSTGTRTLQDQIFHRDLPVLAGAIGVPARIALLKGRANYLCRHRLALALGARELPGLERVRARARALAKVERWSLSTTDGDIGELGSVAEDDPVWPAVTSTRENCLGQGCAEFRQCHVARARQKAQSAGLVVVNHHLLLADLALREDGFAELLPGADAVIVDEAHQFPEVATQFFGSRIGSASLEVLVRDTDTELTRAGLLDAAGRALLEALPRALEAMRRALAGTVRRIDWEQLDDGFLDAAAELSAALGRLADGLDRPELEPAGVRQCGRRAAEARERLQSIIDMPAHSGVRWLEASGRGFVLEFTPFDVAERLQSRTRARDCAWIYTSATLAIGDDFGHFVRRVGAHGAETRLLPSPFDFASQSRLYLPRGLPDPGAADYTGAVIAAAMPLVRAAGGRSFLLFTSRRALAEAASLFPVAMRPDDPFPLLVQGEAPRDLLLRRFREAGNAVLLATGSFWEGVDVRGPALALVVIDKLPFAPPDDPLLRARLAGLEREGRNPFSEYQLPQAVLALKQGVGRLIRDPDDFGVVLLADPRVRTRNYGRAFLKSLPPMTVTEDEDEAAEFLRVRLAESLPATVS